MNGDEQPGKQRDETDTLLLVTRLRDKDTQAAAELQRLYRDVLLRFCWGYLGRMEEAEDAVQDIACKVLASHEIPAADQFRPWLYKVARNHCLNLLRERATRKDRQALPSASQMADALTGHLTKLVREELRSRLADLVQTLADSQREVLRLRYVEDLSRAEIAQVLDIPESVVKSRLFEGLQKLRESATNLEQT